ncbi:cytochrome P450 [Mycena pura]|uniref:Cytochrome P450 n=1 Tax=Mycena pura TaxID=153505 RepID=A0AAD6UZZ4_9AGAR|nr:cytochrome P450 [Mycena pura]
MNNLLASTSFLVSGILLYLISRRYASKSSTIPGPSAHPLVGHTLQVPTKKTWKYFEKLSHQFGPIVKVSLAGDDIILARRSRNYSSRRPLVYAGKYRSDNLRLALLPYGDTLKKYRAAFHQMLQPRAVGGYEGMQYTESLRLLADLVGAPEEYYHHFLRFPASLVFTLSYGQRINDEGKDLADVQRIFTTFVEDLTPGAHLVDTFPILDWLPDFLSPWRAEAKEKHQHELELYSRLALEVKARMEQDIGLECFAARLWDQQVKLNLTDKEIFYVAGTAFSTGTDTSVTTLLWFIMAMALYPATMKKAQQEIDSIFNSHTLPVFTRMQDLPYCFALVKEVLRWAPTVPLGIPHYADADDEYNGYKIRKGTTVISSLWNMHHNEDEYPNSYTFDPERFLSTRPGKAAVDDSLADGHYGFGFGRRRCPGQHMAMKSTWIAVVRVLWAFDIERRKDASGNLMRVDPNLCTSGLTSRPQEFPVDFVPRSATHIETIMSGQGNI